MSVITIGLAALLATTPTPAPAQKSPHLAVVPTPTEPAPIHHPTMVDFMDRAAFAFALTAYGAWTGLWAAHYLAEGHPAQALMPATLAGAGLGAGLAYWLEPRLTLQTTMPAIGFGLPVGTLISYIGVGAANAEMNATTASAIWAAGLGTAGVVGAMAHYQWLRRNEMAVLLSGAMIGATLGKSTLMMMTEINPFLNQSRGMLVGALAGTVAFPMLARWLEISRERSAYLELGALSGGLLGVGTSLMAGFSSPTIAGAMLFGGVAVGWGTAWGLTSEPHQPTPAKQQASRALTHSSYSENPPHTPGPRWRLTPGLIPWQNNAGEAAASPGMKFSMSW